jgi:hypothetical protein
MILLTIADEAAIEANIKQFLLVLSVSLSVATLPQIVSWFRQIPYTLLLVIVGSILALVDVRLVNLSPELILSIFLPPLLFEAAWNLQWSNLKRDMIPICLYAVVGVSISIAGVVLGLNQLAGISLTTALLVGASLSATDPVSVTALFRELGVEKRLTTLMEGESLFNDGMAVVAFSFLVAFSLGTSTASTASRRTIICRCWYRYRRWQRDRFRHFLFNPKIRFTFSRTVFNLSFRLRCLSNYRRFGRIWRNWSCHHRLDFGQLWLSDRHESPHSDYRDRILGVSGFFCKFDRFSAHRRPNSLCRFR